MKFKSWRSYATLVCIGIFFHICYILSIFDIYFRSPIVHGMNSHVTPFDPPAKRLVFFVGDGLRADKFFELDYATGKSRAPFLRSILETHGKWGVSHTRVPTETRPGHVALLAGFYEDVSAVTKGWKKNPVEFDSVLNESLYSWAFGSPDVLPMFGENSDHIFIDTYDSNDENFGSDATTLDTWVFQKVKNFLDSSKNNASLFNMLHRPRIIFFLHLLGLDTTGHANRPYSSIYYDHIRFVDSGIEKMYELFEEYFGDKSTAYLFTSDHGMSNKGSHGDGEKANTETPIVCWGAGFSGLLPSGVYQHRNRLETPREWALDHLARIDVEQADLAPLMAAVIGVPFPLNSVGILPIDFLNASDLFKTTALIYNAKQILSQFQRKHQIKQQQSALWFHAFQPLEQSRIQLFLEEINCSIDRSDFKETEKKSMELIQLCLEGLNYYQTYDWKFLMIVISCGYIGWILVVSLFVLENYSEKKADSIQMPFVFSLRSASFRWFLFLGSIMFLYMQLQGYPAFYYFYCGFPIVFWTYIFQKRNVLLDMLGNVFRRHSQRSKEIPSADLSSSPRSIPVLLRWLLLIAVLEMMVIGYFNREVFSLGFILFGFAPFASALISAQKISVRLKWAWLLSCFSASIFPLLPTEFGNSLVLVCIGGLLFLFLTIFLTSVELSLITGDLQWLAQTLPLSRLDYWKACLLLVTILSVCFSEISIQTRNGLPFLNQLLNWTIFAVSLVLTFLNSCKFPMQCAVNAIFSLASSYLLLSISYEMLFYCSFATVIVLWVPMEIGRRRHQFLLPNESIKKNRESPHLPISMADVETSLFYVFLCFAAFFGTGNIASISSFEIASTYRFTTIFDPFLMGALLLWKVVIPFLCVACIFQVIQRLLHIP